MSSFVALDLESAGKDFYHSSRPFFVTSCTDLGRSRQWEWAVDPLTRRVTPDPREVEQIREVVKSYPTLVFHNSKFDVTGFRTIGVEIPWDKVEDTLVAAHVLDSSADKGLDDLAKRYLGEDIGCHEAKLEAAVKTGRRRVSSARLVSERGNEDEVQKQLREWQIAKSGMPGLPSIKGGSKEDEKIWRNDYWLPAALALHYPENPEFVGFATVLAEYAEIDSSVTALLWPVLRDELVKRGFWKVYKAKLAAVPAAFRMETRGVTINKTVLDNAKVEYTEEAEYLGQLCVGIAKSMGYALTLPKSTTNHSLDDFVFGRARKGEDGKRNPKLPRDYAPDTLNLVPVGETDCGNPSFNYDAREMYLAQLKPGTKPYLFVESFGRRCELDTGLSYLAGYERFVIPTETPGIVVLHPNLNTVGTNTTRWSHNNPNCFDGETELLTTEGWVRADVLTEDHVVAQFDKSSSLINFTRTERVVRQKFVGTMRHITSEQQIDMLLTPDHRCLIEHRKTGHRYDIAAWLFKDDHRHINAGQFVGGHRELTGYEVSWLCAVQADGSYEKQDNQLYGVKFVFKKQRKIDRLRKCLVGMGTVFTERKTADRTSFYVGKNTDAVRLAKALMPTKVFGPWVLELSRRTLDLFVREVFEWDGTSSGRTGYSSSIKTNVDFVQAAMCLSGHRSNIRSYTPNSAWSKSDHHYLNVCIDRPTSLTTNHDNKEVPWDGLVYCVTVPTGYVVIRRNGKVSITGNSANVSERSVVNARACFCPAPGREWYSMDAANIELRIPAYLAGERELIDVFERPNDPPYYGSYHMLVFDTLHPELFAKYGKNVKTECASEYSCVKNGNFARQYGAQEAKADATYRVRGAYRKIGQRFPKIDALNRRTVAFARDTGGVFTVPDRSVDPGQGYPITCRRSQWGTISPTVPFAYFVSGTAGFWLNQAVVRCDALLERWRRDEGYDGYMILSVHDELCFDLVAGVDNSGRVAALRTAMEQGGADIGVPTPVTCERHTESWAVGEPIK